MFSFFRKKKKKVHEKWFLFMAATIAVAFGIGNELSKGTSAVVVPVNEAFDDISFYMCVVDAYNSEKSEDAETREYSDNLTDDELAVITSLNCSAIGYGIENVEKIKSTKGIEKLVSLVDLELFEHEVSTMDLSSNVMLENIHIYDNQLTELNISNNTGLLILNAQNNKLTNIDVSNNVNLTYLDVSENSLTSIDISENVDLELLYVNDNQLNELDLSNNNELLIVNSMGNNFSKEINLYKNNTLTLDSIENIIKLPTSISQDLFSWLVWSFNDVDMISVSENNIVTGLAGGTGVVIGGIDHNDITTEEGDISYFLIENIIYVIDISSQVYTINEENEFVYVGNDTFDVNNINIIEYSLNVDSDKLQILNEDDILTEFNILSVDFGELNVVDKSINIISEISYDNFISNIVKSEKLSYKILDSNGEIVDNKNIIGGERLEISYDDILLDTYNITVVEEIVSDVEFSDNIILDEVNGYIKYKKVNSFVKDLLSNVNTTGSAKIIVSDVEDNEKTVDDVVVSGDKLTVYVDDEKVNEYLIAVMGDANGDGMIDLTDLIQLRKHIVGWINPNTGIVERKSGIYYQAIDMNNDGEIDLIDLIKIRKAIVGIDIYEED